MHLILLGIIEMLFIWSEISTILSGKGNYRKEWEGLDLKSKIWRVVLYLGILSFIYQIIELLKKGSLPN